MNAAAALMLTVAFQNPPADVFAPDTPVSATAVPEGPSPSDLQGRGLAPGLTPEAIQAHRRHGGWMIAGGSVLMVAGVATLAGTAFMGLVTIAGALTPAGSGSAAPFALTVAGSLLWPAAVSGGATMVGIGAKWRRDAKQWQVAQVRPTFGLSKQGAQVGFSFRF